MAEAYDVAKTSLGRDLNPRPRAYQARALPAEPPRHLNTILSRGYMKLPKLFIPHMGEIDRCILLKCPEHHVALDALNTLDTLELAKMHGALFPLPEAP